MKPIHKNLTFQVLLAISIGATIGYIKPAWGQALQPLGDGFIRLVKMVVGPIIFLTIVIGIAAMGDLKKVGRVGIKSLIYFEIVTTLALGIGLLVANLMQPGAGIHKEMVAKAAKAAATMPTTLPASAAMDVALAPSAATTQPSKAGPTTAPAAQAEIIKYEESAKKQTTSDFLLHVIPENIVGAFASGDLLQILFFSVLFGCAIAALGAQHSKLVVALEELTEVMFKVVAIIMKVAPLGALGAMGFTIGKYGLGSLVPLAKLMLCVYLTMAFFIFGVLGVICRLFGFSLWPYLKFVREEILLVLGTSSSESALPRMIQRCEELGCSRAVVGMVIPAGYSFNLDGTSIYLSMAILFIAQAFGVHMSFGQQLWIMGILMLTSKGAAGVTGGGFVTLAATLAATHVLPIEGLALLLGVDRFMSEARAITNVIGNGVAAICVSKWEGEFNVEQYNVAVGLAKPHVEQAHDPLAPVAVESIDQVAP